MCKRRFRAIELDNKNKKSCMHHTLTVPKSTKLNEIKERIVRGINEYKQKQEGTAISSFRDLPYSPPTLKVIEISKPSKIKEISFTLVLGKIDFILKNGNTRKITGYKLKD